MNNTQDYQHLIIGNDKPEPLINKGDLVLYWDVKAIKTGNRVKNVKVGVGGYWDGEKVECCDKEHTIVRNKKWLTKVNEL